jgi:membrane protein
LKRLSRVLLDLVNCWIDHRGASKGAALTFYTLCSMTPILILANQLHQLTISPRRPRH